MSASRKTQPGLRATAYGFSRIVVTEENASGLRQDEWTFWLQGARDGRLRLDSYTQASRPTTRHKFAITKQWHRLDHRRSDMASVHVPTPDTVGKLAVQTAAASLSVAWFAPV